jgi:hypothetical protein
VVGVLAAAGSIRLALLADALTFAVSLLSLMVAGRGRVRPARRRLTGGWRDVGQDFRAGVRYLLSVRVLVILTAVQVVVNLCLACEKLIIYDARITLGLTPPAVGVVVGAAGAGGIVGALTAARLAALVGEIRLVVAAIVAAGLAISAMSAAATAPVLAGANAAYACALVQASLVNRTQRQRLVPREMLGRVTSTVRVLFLAVDPLGVVIAGSVAAVLGDPRPVFLGAGVMIVATAAAGWAAGLRAVAVGPDERGYAAGGEAAGD